MNEMKYFVSLVTRGTFVISAEAAYDVYADLEDAKLIEPNTTDFSCETGRKVSTRSGSATIWGEEMSDQELFKKILNGEVQTSQKAVANDS